MVLFIKLLFIKLLYVTLLLENVKRIKRMGLINIYSIGRLLNLFYHYYVLCSRIKTFPDESNLKVQRFRVTYDCVCIPSCEVQHQ